MEAPISNAARPKCQILKSLRNVFGLFRQYHAVDYPTHDPDEEAELSNVPESSENSSVEATELATAFQPYPNKSAFLLGEWYWNGGVQKSKEGFKKLIEIVSGQSFDPSDVRNVAWDALNKQLRESPDSEDIWLDQPDTSWTEKSITLSIPFQKKAHNPGPQPYMFPPF